MTGRRVARLEIEDFKGFQGRLDLNLDAEVVLLVGPNGRGKTSTIEALELLVTGGIGRRVGGKNEFDLRDFIHCDRSSGVRRSKATVRATWSGNGGSDTVVINHSSRDSLDAAGPLAELRAAEWRSQSEADLVRACSFLYSDSLGSLAGLDLEARRQVIDFFVPSFPWLDELTGHETPRIASQVASALQRVEAGLPDIGERRTHEARKAAVAQDAWNASNAGLQAKFVKKGPELIEMQSLLRMLKKVCEVLMVEFSSLGDYQQVLSQVAKAAEERASQAEADYKNLARKKSKTHGAWVAVQGALRTLERELGRSANSGILSLEQLKSRRQLIGQAADLHNRRAELEGSQVAVAQALDGLWQDEKLDAAPDGLPKVSVGAIPLLANLVKFASSAGLPTWWKELGLPEPDLARFRSFLAIEQQQWGDLRIRQNALATQLREVELAYAELAVLDAIEPRLQELEAAWIEAEQAAPLPARSDGTLAVEEIRSAAAAGLMSVEPTAVLEDASSAMWRSVAEAFSAWERAHVEVVKAERLLSERAVLESTRRRLEELQGIVEHVGSNRKGCFKDILRAVMIEQRYEEDLNASMRRVLRWYAHRRDVIENARIEFHRHGPLQVRIGPEDGASTGIASLSRSQLTSLAFGLAIAANLGRPALPTNFLCLDDVSDAFDLDNLAADAAMLRMLAYGEHGDGSYGRRQLILTNHNDQLTNRIVPLLLPPAGRRMRIIEFIDKGHDEPIQAKQWVVQGEQRDRWNRHSPLRALVPAVSAGVSHPQSNAQVTGKE